MTADATAWYLQGDVWNVALAALAIVLSLYAILEGKRTAKRSGVIELHGAWLGVNELDPANLIGPDVALAAQALNVTAAVWNHHVVDKAIVYESYWQDYKNLYGVLAASTAIVPGYQRPAWEFVNAGMRRAYRGMNDWERSHARNRRSRAGQMEADMAMQPMMQPEPQQPGKTTVQLAQLLDDIHERAERARALAEEDPTLERTLHERTLQDILPILLGPAGQRCTTCGGSGRQK